MNKVHNNTIEKTRNYIIKNAQCFDFTTLFKMLEKLGYSIKDIDFIPEESLKSQEAYINKVMFTYNSRVIIQINDINISAFLDNVSDQYGYNPKVMDFFIGLFSEILYTCNTAIYLEGKTEILSSYRNGNALVSINDGNLRSFSYIHDFLKRLLSEYETVIYEKKKEITDYFNPCKLGASKLSKNCKLGNRLTMEKDFIFIRIITELKLDDKSVDEINKKIDLFKYRFQSILKEINVILYNCITDKDLYTKIPFTLTKESCLLQRYETLRCECNM